MARYSVTISNDDDEYDIDRMVESKFESKSKIIADLVHDGIKMNEIRLVAEKFASYMDQHCDDEQQEIYDKFQIEINDLLFNYDMENGQRINGEFDEKKEFSSEIKMLFASTTYYLLKEVLPSIGTISKE
jgi:hypothetical protein